MIYLIILSVFILMSCAAESQKLSGINYIDIVQVDGKITISYYAENPLKREHKLQKRKYKLPVCRKGNSLWAIWIWDIRKLENRWNRFRELVKEWKIKRVYLQVSRSLTQSHIDKLRNLGLEVFLLDGGKDIKLNFDLNYINSFKVKGFQVDIEPYTKSDFNVRKDIYVKLYVRKLAEIKKKLKNKTFSVVIPFWYESIQYNGKPLLEYIFEYADEVVVMSYRSALESALKLSLEEIYYGKIFKKPVFIGFELYKQKDEMHNIYKVGKDGLTLVGSYKVRGDILSIPLTKLKEIRDVKCEGVSGFVIHSFESF